MHRPCIRNNLSILLLHIELKRKIKFSFSIHGKRLDGENAENSREKEACLITATSRARDLEKLHTRYLIDEELYSRISFLLSQSIRCIGRLLPLATRVRG